MIEAFPVTIKQTDDIHWALIEAARSMDEITHNVQDWAGYLRFLLQDLEFFAMANDPTHPEQYERLLQELRDTIQIRLEQGSWPSTPFAI